MTVSRLRYIPGIGVDVMGNAADAANDPSILRLENLDTDVPPPAVAVATTHRAVEDDAANSYLPFQGHWPLREAVAAHVSRISNRRYEARTQCLSVAGGLNGITNMLLATVEPGQEVVLFDPVYAGLVNRVHIAGGVPRFVPSRPTPQGCRTDPDELAAAVGPGTAAVMLMGPVMPTGALLTQEHLDALAGPLGRHGAWVIYDAAMERLRFDGGPPLNPASHPELADRAITVGSASKELRMIGWRVGWVTGPAPIVADIGLVGLTNVVCQVGIAQQAVADALSAPDADADVARATGIGKQRADSTNLVSGLAGASHPGTPTRTRRPARRLDHRTAARARRPALRDPRGHPHQPQHLPHPDLATRRRRVRDRLRRPRPRLLPGRPRTRPTEGLASGGRSRHGLRPLVQAQ